MDIIISTRESFENDSNVKYVGFVDSQVVLGVNLLADFAAGLTDIFGGRSSGYQERIQKITQIAINEIKLKARTMGANAILAFRINVNQISGKDKSMLMISAFGTACEVDIKNNVSLENVQQIITANLISSIEKKNRLLSKNYLSEEDIEYIIENNITELFNKLFIRISDFPAMDFATEKTYSMIFRFFINVEFDEAVSIVYNYVLNSKDDKLHKMLGRLCAEQNLIDYTKMIKLFESNDYKVRNFALYLLNWNKRYLASSDITAINKLINTIQNLSDISKIVTDKSMFSKEKKVWQCQVCECKNNLDAEYCNCGIDKFGLSKNNTKENLIDFLKSKITILNNLGIY